MLFSRASLDAKLSSGPRTQSLPLYCLVIVNLGPFKQGSSIVEENDSGQPNNLYIDVVTAS